MTLNLFFCAFTWFYDVLSCVLACMRLCMMISGEEKLLDMHDHPLIAWRKIDKALATQLVGCNS